MDPKWLLFSFEGRVNRQPYWIVAIIMFVIGAGLNFAVGNFGPGGIHAGRGGPVLWLLALLFAWIGLAMQVKRWHDRDKSGWWALISLVPVIGFFWVLIECGFVRGTDGPNRFGPDPLRAV
jgi:uncharacterized membrane protein YhaH (DUF805 family)